ncbi:MAG: DUF5689 domain-containing protein [Bacteroidota bacterium]
MNNGSTKTFIIILLILDISCVADRDFNSPSRNCTTDFTANITYAEVKELYNDETIQIQEDRILEGYVTSSDEAGNFFNVLHFQDSPVNPTHGFQIEIDLRDSHLFYPVGTKIFIKLGGLYLGKRGEVFRLGGTFIAFGNLSVGRLPTAVLEEHIFVSCDEVVDIVPAKILVNELQDSHINTLVHLEDTEVLEEELGLPFAIEREETERTLTDCDDNELTLLNSGFADFQAELLPEGNGSITGVLTKDGNDFQLIIRDLEDIDFSGERCENLVDEFTSNALFFSELADPDNNTRARFVELYNSALEPLPLKGWTLKRYTNDNTEVSSVIDLSELTVGAESTLLISPNAEEFDLVYGFAPDLDVGTNSPADSNGDDNLELIDPFGTVIDVFGVPGEDGTGTDHEFEDGRAVRKPEITKANPTFTFSEWVIYNDSGEAGTINRPQNAPEDFTPGIRE